MCARSTWEARTDVFAGGAPLQWRDHRRGKGRRATGVARPRQGGASMLLVKDLHAYYGRAHILHRVSLEASAGEVVALLGRNGAGKSTVMKTIMGLVPAAAGEVTFDGRRIERLA